MSGSRIVGWLLVLVLPGLLLSAYLYVSRTIRIFSNPMDFSALAMSVAVGLVGVLVLVRPPASRALSAGLYVVLAGGTMYWSMVRVVCVAFGDCYS